ncbi:hypothetical protein BD626DRAFT_482937 [Schizophyllum amplum]|uniref:Uncharacterized protein n=1 Tax=Schizophyllum amplum TaxID=97359 RepID=A0A550CP21_9AGAR|nr:hypothetical protein BD626DRAFT_482937 [Auriculariopsis ampla]
MSRRSDLKETLDARDRYLDLLHLVEEYRNFRYDPKRQAHTRAHIEELLRKKKPFVYFAPDPATAFEQHKRERPHKDFGVASHTIPALIIYECCFDPALKSPMIERELRNAWDTAWKWALFRYTLDRAKNSGWTMEDNPMVTNIARICSGMCLLPQGIDLVMQTPGALSAMLYRWLNLDELYLRPYHEKFAIAEVHKCDGSADASVTCYGPTRSPPLFTKDLTLLDLQ